MKKTSEKTSERTDFLNEVIKDSLLKLLKKKDYNRITVSDLCRCANVSRGTFYKYYGNLDNVIKALFSDALKDIGNMALIKECPPEGNEKCGLALCWFLRRNKKYQPLFFSDSLMQKAINSTVAALKEGFVEKMAEPTGLTPETLSQLLLFQITGCISVCKKNINEPDKVWRHIQCHVDEFLKSGFHI